MASEDRQLRPVWLFRAMRITEFIAVLAGLTALGFELQDRQEERAVRKARVLAEVALLKLEHGPQASPAIRSSLEVLVEQGVNLRGIDLQAIDLRGAKLRGAKLSHANLGNALAWTADFSESDLTFASFEGALMPEANFRAAYLARANLRSAKLQRSDLSSADLSESSLRGATFDGTDFAGATLAGADLSAAEMRNARNLTQAQVDEACWDLENLPILPAQLKEPHNQCPYI